MPPSEKHAQRSHNGICRGQSPTPTKIVWRASCPGNSTLRRMRTTQDLSCGETLHRAIDGDSLSAISFRDAIARQTDRPSMCAVVWSLALFEAIGDNRCVPSSSIQIDVTNRSGNLR